MEPLDPMVDHTSRLPDEVIGHILSFLTVRDAVRARLSSARWLQLRDSRSVLCLDSLNVLGVKNIWKARPELQSMFVRIVNRYMELSMGNRISKLTFCFDLGYQHASDIDRWIATSNAVGVEEMELDFTGMKEEEYDFPSHLLCFGNAPCLKQLRLRFCQMSLSSQCKSWLSNLTTLHLTYVPLDESEWQRILSAGSNLTTLVLVCCSLRGTIFINGQLPCLSKFITHENHLESIKLNCPNLEVFEYTGCATLCFDHVPTLREASVWYPYNGDDYGAKVLDHVTRNAQQLQALSLNITYEAQLFRATLAASRLKQLYLDTAIPIGFDLLNFTDVFNACPFLETLHIELCCLSGDQTVQSQRREYPDRLNFHLKEVKIIESRNQWNEVELAMYILKNTVALERMVIDVLAWDSEAEQKATTLLLEKKIHPTAEVILMSPDQLNTQGC